MPRNDASVTPAIVNGRLLSVSVWPASVSPPKYLLQKRCETTTAGGASLRSSSGVSRRPIAIGTPRSAKKLPATYSPETHAVAPEGMRAAALELA
jgi:hypothetical protein